MIKAVILDFDDTLCLTEEACFYLENAALSRLGRKPMDRQIHIDTWGKPLFEIIETRSPGVDAAAFRQEFVKLHAQSIIDGHVDAISPQNLQALDTLLEQQRELFIVTSRTHDELRHLLEPDHHLAERIRAFYYRDNMEFHKPDPRAFDLLLDHHNYRHHDCVYVGDSVSDAAAAKQAGMQFIASLESGLRKREAFADHAVDAYINTFVDLPQAIEQLDARLS